MIFGPKYLVSQSLRILQTQSRQRGLIKTNMKIILPPFSIRCMAASFTVRILKNTQILREDMFTLARYKIVLCSLGTQLLYNSVHICSIARCQMPFLYVRVEESTRSGLPWNKQKTCSTGTRCPLYCPKVSTSYSGTRTIPEFWLEHLKKDCVHISAQLVPYVQENNDSHQAWT